MIGTASRGETKGVTGTGGCRLHEKTVPTASLLEQGMEGLLGDKAALLEGGMSELNKGACRSGHKLKFLDSKISSFQP